MGIEQGEKTLKVKVIERTWRTEIDSSYGGVPVITAHREVLKIADGEVISRERGIVVQRSLEELKNADDSVKFKNKTVTAVEMAEYFSAFIDKWAGERTASDVRMSDRHVAIGVAPKA